MPERYKTGRMVLTEALILVVVVAAVFTLIELLTDYDLMAVWEEVRR